MTITIERASPDDAAEIAELLGIVWPNESPKPEQAAAALDDPNHAAHIAIGSNHVVGVVSGFKTHHWEVDLLAVHPEFRGRGIAYRLLQCTTDDAAAHRCGTARALVEISNTASQRAFAGAGYESDSQPLTLYVSRTGAPAQGNPAQMPRIIPVRTLLYTGAWIEGTVDHDALAWARGQQLVLGWERLGILSGSPAPGFEPAGTFAWWFRDVYLRPDLLK